MNETFAAPPQSGRASDVQRPPNTDHLEPTRRFECLRPAKSPRSPNRSDIAPMTECSGTAHISGGRLQVAHIGTYALAEIVDEGAHIAGYALPEIGPRLLPGEFATRDFLQGSGRERSGRQRTPRADPRGRRPLRCRGRTRSSRCPEQRSLVPER